MSERRSPDSSRQNNHVMPLNPERFTGISSGGAPSDKKGSAPTLLRHRPLSVASPGTERDVSLAGSRGLLQPLYIPEVLEEFDRPSVHAFTAVQLDDHWQGQDACKYYPVRGAADEIFESLDS